MSCTPGVYTVIVRPSWVVALSTRPSTVARAILPALASSRNWEYSMVLVGVWRVLNWLNTVISTTPMTIQIARFLKRLFNVLFPESHCGLYATDRF